MEVDAKPKINRDEWLKNLKVGDTVAIDMRHKRYKLVVIDGETPKFFRVAKKYFTKDTGKERGTMGLYANYLQPVDFCEACGYKTGVPLK